MGFLLGSLAARWFFIPYIHGVDSLNLANAEALIVRLSFRHDGTNTFDAAAADDDHHHHKHLRPWRRRLLSSLMALCYLSWACAFRSAVFLFLLAAVVTACVTLPIEQFLKDFLIWVKQDLGPWGPLVLAVAYIPLTVLSSSFYLLFEFCCYDVWVLFSCSCSTRPSQNFSSTLLIGKWNLGFCQVCSCCFPFLGLDFDFDKWISYASCSLQSRCLTNCPDKSLRI